MSATRISSAGPVERSLQIRGKDIFKSNTERDAPSGGLDHVQPPLARLDLRHESLIAFQQLAHFDLGKSSRLTRASQTSDELDIRRVLSAGHDVPRDIR
jgi:hypothetical protein